MAKDERAFVDILSITSGQRLASTEKIRPWKFEALTRAVNPDASKISSLFGQAFKPNKLSPPSHCSDFINPGHRGPHKMATAVFSRHLRTIQKLQCQIFQTAYNPTGRRTGSKYLSARLRGPSMVAYYPAEDQYKLNFKKLNARNPGWDLVDVEEVIRRNDVEEKKRRGKGAPKKAKSKSMWYSISSLRFPLG